MTPTGLRSTTRVLPIPVVPVHLALLACIVCALDGGYGLLHPQASARAAGLRLEEGARLSGVRAQSGARLLAHAATAAALMQAPAVGACVAAGLGSAWLGAGAGRAFGAFTQGPGRGADLLRAAGALTLGAAMWWPLWRYLAALRLAAAGTVYG